VYKNANTRV